MPKVISYTPGWLSRPSPGFQVFNTAQSTSFAQAGSRESSQQCNGDYGTGHYVGPHRVIAQRGTEIFLAVGRQIRWTDLVSLKDDDDGQLQTPSKRPKPTPDTSRSRETDDGPEDGSYRVLKVPIGEQIRQLSVSPNGDLLAIATSHTVHIAILPNSSHLGQIENGQIANKPIKLKTYTIGPTAHVLSHSGVTNILWHPCGVGGNCLVTVTADAIIRLWEIKHEDRFSFANPALAIDLKKLVTASSEEDNFAPDKFERNRGFSPDDVGLEVASACFGGSGSNQESGWSAITLWIAMKGGDVYALCPLLPSKWQPPATLIPSLSQSAVAKNASRGNGEPSDPERERQCKDQLEWIRDVDGQDPVPVESDDDFAPQNSEIYRRPSRPGSIPRLQGPFQMPLEDAEEVFELSDIRVIAAKIDDEDFRNDDSDSEAESMDERGVSASVVVLLTTSGMVYMCLDLEGVEGQWLPRKKPKRSLPAPRDPYLVVLEGLNTLTKNEQLDEQWPTISRDVKSPHSFFVTHNNGVFYFSCDPWIQSLEKELQSSEKFGAPLRIDLIMKGPGTLRERILSFEDEEYMVVPNRAVSTCVTFEDSDLGYFLLTSVDGHPHAVTFNEENRLYGRTVREIDSEEDEIQLPELNSLTLGPARTIYQPSDAFYAESSLPKFLERNVHSRHRRMIKENVLMSTATLDLMTHAHRVLSQETHCLQLAASDLFRRCKILRDMFSNQVSQVNELAHRTERLSGKDADSYSEHIKRKQPQSVDERLRKVRSRQAELVDRYDKLRKNFSKVGGRELSEKEKQWVAEVDNARKSIKGPREDKKDGEATKDEDGEGGEDSGVGEDGEDTDPPSNLWTRCDEVVKLKEKLIEHVNEISQDGQPQDNHRDSDLIPDDERQRRLEEVESLLRTQSNLVEEAQIRLHRLTNSVMT